MISPPLLSLLLVCYACTGLGMSMYSAPMHGFNPKHYNRQYDRGYNNMYPLYHSQPFMLHQQGFYAADDSRQRDRRCTGSNCGYWGDWGNCHGADCSVFYDFRPCHSPQCLDGPVQGLNCHGGNCQRVCLDGICHDFVCSGKKCGRGGGIMTKSAVEKDEPKEEK